MPEVGSLEGQHPHRTAFVNQVRYLLAAVSAAEEAESVFSELTPSLQEMIRQLPLRDNAVPFFWGAVESLPEDRRMQHFGEAWSRFNPMAPQLSLRVDEERHSVTGTFCGTVAQCGPPGMVHGGVCALVIDHVMGVLSATLDKPSFTKSLAVRYLKPTPLDTEISIAGGIVSEEGRYTKVWVELSAGGMLTVRAEGEMVRVPAGTASVKTAGEVIKT